MTSERFELYYRLTDITVEQVHNIANGGREPNIVNMIIYDNENDKEYICSNEKDMLEIVNLLNDSQ
jgi:hypothetical protein